MSRKMGEDEWRAFVTHGTRTAKLAVTRADGRPHVVPVWFVLDDEGRVVFTTGEDTVKGKAIRRDPRLCLCVDEEVPPFAYVSIAGDAGVSRDPNDLLHWATRIGGRYMGEDRAEAFGRRNAVPTELLVRVTPTRVIANANISD